MVLLKSFKAFFNKENIFNEYSIIDLYKFHPQLRVLLAFQGIFFNNSESSLRLIWPILSALLCLVAAAFQMMFIHHGLDTMDYSMATESFCYLIILLTVPIIYTIAYHSRAEILQLLDSMNNDFLYVCRLNAKYRCLFLEGQLIIWKLSIAWYIFVAVIFSMYVGSAFLLLLYQSLFETQTEYTERPLMFPMWLPKDDPYRTPNYEVFLFLELVILIILPQSFGVYINVLFHILLHPFFIMVLIECDFEVLFDGLDENVVNLPLSDPIRIQVQLILNKRLKRIVEWHNSVLKTVDTVSSVYGPGLMYQVALSSLVICLTAYQVADSLDHGKLHIIFAMLCFACCLQLWIPCYLGTLIRNKAFSVGHAAWNCGWHETPLGRLVKQDMIFFIMRSQQPVNIKFTGLPKLELETFSSIMSSAYSYFNLLRQYK